jgi:RHS repeat-associated protein
VSFVYDGDGNRVGKTVNGVTTRYLVDTNNPTGYAQVVDELTGNQVTRTYTYGHDLISENQVINNQWTASFYGYDGHGSTRYLTDSTGTITDTYTYDAFGNLSSQTGTTPNDYLYSGEQYDSNLGFYYLRARYLNPQSDRFISMDSFEGYDEDTLTLHKYLYANANPANTIDPSGKVGIEEEVIVLNGLQILVDLVALNLYMYLQNTHKIITDIERKRTDADLYAFGNTKKASRPTC